jgi:hypothetical protein
MDYLKAFALPVAIVILAAAVLFHDRYDGRVEGGGFIRVDHLTGGMSVCAMDGDHFVCKDVPRVR